MIQRRLSALALLVALPMQSVAVEVLDATGARIRVVDKPKRIVALAPSLGELAADILGADLENIVGVSDYTDYPPALKKIRSVGPYHRFSLETVVALKPDLILATLDGNPKDHVLHLREIGLPVVVVPSGDFASVEKSIHLVGKAIGRERMGKELATRFRTGLKKIQERAKARKSRSVFIQIGADPLVSIGKGSFLHHAVEVVGGRNVFGDLSGGYPRPTAESVLARDPEVILVLALGTEKAREFEKMANDWKRFSKLKAVKSGEVGVLKADALLRPSMRLLEGLVQLERRLYPGSTK